MLTVRTTAFEISAESQASAAKETPVSFPLSSSETGESGIDCGPSGYKSFQFLLELLASKILSGPM